MIPGLPDRLGVLTLAPESALPGFLVILGHELARHGLVLRAATVAYGCAEFGDFLYSQGPTHASNRLARVPWGWLAAAEWDGQMGGLVLVEGEPADGTPTHELLNRIKGSSRNPKPGTLRALSALTSPLLSFVHVPDDGVAPSVAHWAFAPIARLGPAPADQLAAWASLQDLLTPIGVGRGGAGHVLAASVRRCVDLLRLGRFTDMPAGRGDDVEACSASGDWPAPLGEAGERLRAVLAGAAERLVTGGFAERRAAFIAELACWLLDPSRWDLADMAEVAGCLTRAGIAQAAVARQLLLGRMYYEGVDAATAISPEPLCTTSSD